MDEAREESGRGMAAALWRQLRPAVPAMIAAAALTFLFAVVMPLAWVGGISWNLYLDRVSDLFAPPVGNGGRWALALGMAAITASIAGFVALALAKPVVRGNGALNRRVAARAKRQAASEELLPRRRADAHPDDAPRPPIRADRDLPAGGLGPYTPVSVAEEGAEALELSLAQVSADDGDDELILADLAPMDYSVEAEDAPWLQAVETSGPALPDPADNSLGAMVARFEAGLAQRRRIAAALPTSTAPPVNDDDEPAVDFALEAALSTLERMSRRAVG